MDHNWMNYPRSSEDFKVALNSLDESFAKDAIGDQIFCLCKTCSRRFRHSRDDVYDHLIINGFVKGFKEWVLQREGYSFTSNDRQNVHEVNNQSTHDDIDGLLHDTFIDVSEGLNRDHEVESEPIEEARKFFHLVEEGKKELYPGCKTFSKLSFIIRLFLFKCLNGLSNVAFGDLLELLREAFPMAELPKSFNESRNIVKNLGLDYINIHACPNDCILYRKEFEGANVCPKCAEQMVWHDKGRMKDDKIRHPTDAQSWKDFDSSYPAFKNEARNVRLALASDGFNPFRTMSVAHSTWSVVLINYNLPPWVSMKPEYFMLSLLIPGPKSPGNDIDVFLQPLIDELKELWEFGVETYDASKKQSFKLHAALMGTINDFPAYSMLS
ncbi:uncharacterized protein LOC110703758 [Chenopodium quinoa]|uniref:uncharacterized protein LOC110703758 n=1 Tax=Chenopodium quinoa TaxID=63459 RepID=UPI000B79509E|nr:uncharacterized protein LOC110703758 [Chenopodium quinoa]